MLGDQPDPIWGSLLLQAVLILINAFFSATEVAVLSLSENKIRRQLDAGERKAFDLLQMIKSPSQFLSTVQVGSTLAGFIASAFAANSFSGRMVNWFVRIGLTMVPMQALESASIVIVTFVLSYFTLVFGELVPKRIAMQYAYAVGKFASGAVRVFSVITRPAVRLLMGSTNALLKLFRIDTERDDEEVTEENIRLMVDIGEEKGVIEAEEAELIENIFEFNNMTANEVMVHRTDVSAISIADTHEEILRVISETGFSRFPVFDEDLDDIIGTLNTREYLLNAISALPRPFRDLIRPAYFVPGTVHTDILFRDMQRRKTHIAVVVDEYGGTSGIVTMEDLLEEIVGDIFDEFDPQEEQEIQRLEPNLWRVNGSVDLETLSEALDAPLPLDEEFDTLGGLVYSQMSAIPEDGATPTVIACGLRIQVEKIEDRRVESALISKMESSDDKAAEQGMNA
ncbi:MAG: hemolysin family protein [Clostridia bacterium]|nr:hemolysin family protein [Clostridia bacterium]